jgi:hypothetical protein
MKSFFKKYSIHIASLVIMYIIVAVFFKPQIDGYFLKQHDIEQWMGAANETDKYREISGEEPLWTNSVFGGMPTTQISVVYPGNYFKRISNFYYKCIPNPMGIVFLHLLGFYILGLFLRIRPLVALLGAIAFGFASYEIIVIQAGHITKGNATALIAPLLGAFIYSYKTNRLWGIIFSALFMAFEIGMNHLQITYYFFFVLFFVGVYLLVDAIQKKQLKSFFITTVGVLAAYLLAFLVNVGNIALTLDYAGNTIRGKNDLSITPNGEIDSKQSVGLDKDYITEWSYGIGESFTLLSPNVKGGGSFPLKGSQFESVIENSDFSPEITSKLENYYAYWGEQPFTTGPVYLGVVICMLTFLGLFFIKSKIKWALFGVSMLALALSWGENFMSLTEFFIDYFPGYNKFRSVTIILIVLELCFPLLAVLFINQFITEREFFKESKKKFLYVSSSFIGLLIIVKIIGLGDHYTSSIDAKQIESIGTSIRSQIASTDPQVLKSQYNLDINDPNQLNQFVELQSKPYLESFDAVKTIRKDIFNESMNRSILFSILIGALLYLFLQTSITPIIFSSLLVLLVLFDIIPISYQYLGTQEQGSGYKYWTEIDQIRFPMSPTPSDQKIMEYELTENPSLKSVVAKGEQLGMQKAIDLEYVGTPRMNAINSHKFYALNSVTNYRVFDFNGAFSSNRTSYFHKSLGGYHGAKLRNINNVFNFHIMQSNYKIFDILNVKYFIQSSNQGEIVTKNENALGNAWFVKSIESYATPDDEIRALGNKVLVSNAGGGLLLINKKPSKTATVYVGETVSYLLPGTSDTMSIAMNNTNQMSEGQEAFYVVDTNGNANLVPAQTLKLDVNNSFKPLVSLKLLNEFKTRDEAIMLKSFSDKLTRKRFTATGNIKMISFAPNKLVYKYNTSSRQFAVFSEIYYADGWEAYIDDKKVDIIKSDYILRGLELPMGKHKIIFKFNVLKYHQANQVASISSIILLLLIGFVSFYEIKKRRRTTK